MAVHHGPVVELSTGPRSRAQRVADARHRLEHDVDVWVATGAGRPHLAPLSLDWDGELVLLATGESTPTARNLLSGGSARLALGTTRDVVSVEARLERHQPAEQVPAPVLERYRRRAGWLPGAGDVVLWLRPVRIQAWREVDEMPGRTLMVGGRWLD